MHAGHKQRESSTTIKTNMFQKYRHQYDTKFGNTPALNFVLKMRDMIKKILSK